ncbi:hypothetical protein B0H12DRAFT_1102362 [Mycena haematopus]|nr:hypothetical protein B0H12DRAFT_1133589 [Mycena haematopus]KAJ7263989.1 hypothetical protein B0H12DRAFT_1102362 [Mycena haematopus]
MRGMQPIAQRETAQRTTTKRHPATHTRGRTACWGAPAWSGFGLYDLHQLEVRRVRRF